MRLTRRLAAEHLEELSFLLRVRFDGAEDAPASAAAETDERIEAHLDGLRFSGIDGVDVLEEALGTFDSDTLFGAAYALASLPELEGALEAAVEAFAAAPEGDTLAAMGAAFRHALHAELPARLAKLLAHQRAEVRAAAADVLGWRRAVESRPLWPLLQDAEPCVRRAAFSAIARIGGPDDRPALEQAAFGRVAGPAADERIALVRLGSWNALEQCRDIVVVAQPSPADLMLLGLAGSAEELARLARHAGAHSAATRAGLGDALGLLGHAGAVTLLIDLLDDQDAGARGAAATALERITGAGLRETVAGDQPDTEAARDPGPWRSWWKANETRFSTAVRYRKGLPFSLATCIDELAAPERPLADRQRAHWELEIRSGQRLPFEPDAAPSDRHRQVVAWVDWWRSAGRTFADGRWTFQGPQ